MLNLDILNWLYYVLIRISDFELEPLIFTKFWNTPSKGAHFSQKKLFYSNIYTFQKQKNKLEISRIKSFGIYPSIF